MTKQEKIIEAWGNDSSKLDDEVKNLLLNHNHGALILKDFKDLLGDIDEDIYTFKKYEFTTCVLPKSLQGIENNNGWIKIESEADLPKENDWYWVIREFSNNIESALFDDCFTNYQGYRVTHYQPIVKPKPPVY